MDLFGENSLIQRLWSKRLALFNSNIGTRLGLMVGFLATLMVVGSFEGYYLLTGAEQQLERISSHRMHANEHAAAVQREVLLNRILLLEALLHGEEAGSTSNYRKKIEANIESITKNWEIVKADTKTEKEKRLAQAFQDARNNFGQNAVLPIMDALRSGDQDSAMLIEEVASGEYAPVQVAITDLIDHHLKQGKADVAAALERNQLYKLVIMISILGGLALAITGSYVIIRSVTGPLKKAVYLADSVAAGDLTQTLTEAKSNDEIGRLITSISNMNFKLREIVTQVYDGVMSVDSSAGQISAGNTNLSQRTEEQASALEETAASMEEMTSTVNQNADSAQQANLLANTARDEAENGGRVVDRAVAAMSEINSSSTRISDIISTIDGIAFQTNLLALNAAVEAARAGEQGRGFAVVASEVRSLAQRSADAAKEIKTLIEDSAVKVKVGTDLVDESGATLLGIVGGIKKVADIVAEINAASQEQSAGINQVNNAVANMDDMTQQNAAMLEESVAATRSMHDQTERLVNLMNFFQFDHGRHSLSARRELQNSAAMVELKRGRNRSANEPEAPASESSHAGAQRQKHSSNQSWEDF